MLGQWSVESFLSCFNNLAFISPPTNSIVYSVSWSLKTRKRPRLGFVTARLQWSLIMSFACDTKRRIKVRVDSLWPDSERERETEHFNINKAFTHFFLFLGERNNMTSEDYVTHTTTNSVTGGIFITKWKIYAEHCEQKSLLTNLWSDNVGRAAASVGFWTIQSFHHQIFSELTFIKWMLKALVFSNWA